MTKIVTLITSSWAENSISATTASYASTAETLLGSIESSSFATTSSYSLTAQTLLGTVSSASWADTLDGQHGSYYTNASNLSSGTLLSSRFVTSSRYYPIDPSLTVTNQVNSHLALPSLGQAAIEKSYLENKLILRKPITVEYSTSSGAEWVEYTGYTDTQLGNLMLGRYHGGTALTCSRDWTDMRMTWDPPSYVYLDALYLYTSTQGNQIALTIERRNYDTSLWSTVCTTDYFSSWPGHQWVPHTNIAFGSLSGRYDRVRLTFTLNHLHASNTVQLNNVNWYGSYPAAQQNAITYWNRDGSFHLRYTGSTIGGHTIWHAGNDGASSTLDADLLDGQHGSYYLNASNINAGTINDAYLPSTITSTASWANVSITSSHATSLPSNINLIANSVKVGDATMVQDYFGSGDYGIINSNESYIAAYVSNNNEFVYAGGVLNVGENSTIISNDLIVTGSIQSTNGVTGSLQGTASYATTAQTLIGSVSSASYAGSASLVYIEQDLSQDELLPLTFVDSTDAGYQRLNVDTVLTYHPLDETLNVPYISATGGIYSKFFGNLTGSVKGNLDGTASVALTSSYVGNSTYFVDPDNVDAAINVAGKIQGDRFVDSVSRVLLGTDIVGGESGLVGDGDDYIAVKINSTGQYLYGNSYLEVDGATGDITGSHYIKAVKGFVGDLTGSVQGTASVALTSSYVGNSSHFLDPDRTSGYSLIAAGNILAGGGLIYSSGGGVGCHISDNLVESDAAGLYSGNDDAIAVYNDSDGGYYYAGGRLYLYNNKLTLLSNAGFSANNVQLTGSFSGSFKGEFDKIGISLDGGGGIIPTGSYADTVVPWDCTIKKWYLYGDQDGWIDIDVKKSNYASYPTFTSITGSTDPNLNDESKQTDSTLSGWTTSLSKDDIVRFEVIYCDQITKANLTLIVQK